MSDWHFLNRMRVKQPTPAVSSMYISTDDDGFNGMFRFILDGLFLRCIASDGEGWRHVSVSIEGEPQRVPPWKIMCKIKDLFWGDEDWVVQFHPAKSEYVNNHPGCLHLWQPTEAKLPTPDSLMVGYK